ncbi:glycosyl hydrolase family 7 domain-containing protein [Sarocladium implicatum]|nr:glycosyl hydrolase family 7 domain-containing protein [Sarocladium implicatum]
MSLAIILFLPLLAGAQLIGTEVPEEHPPLTWSRCSSSGCTDVAGSIVLDAEHRWLRINDSSYASCYQYSQSTLEGGGFWSGCDSNEDCTKRCALEGGEYAYTGMMDFGERSVSMDYHRYQDFATKANLRAYLLEEENKYQTFILLDNEVAFDVDLSKVPCGLNAAIRFVAMDADGGTAKYPTQKAGAKYGAGFCDAQCTRSLRYVAGEANYEQWVPAERDPQGGEGSMGACCSEMSLWNSNKVSYTMASKPCINHEYDPCETDNCGHLGSILPNRCAREEGCDHNPYRLGNDDFFGPGNTVDTNASFTVVTQFQESGVNQYFIQDGKRIDPPAPHWNDIPDPNGGITEDYCNVRPEVFGSRDLFNEVGGWDQHVDALRQPMVMALSIDDDYYAYNLWLDGHYPLDLDPTVPGAVRGTCGLEESDPSYLRRAASKAAVTFSNFRFGPVGTTAKLG